MFDEFDEEKYKDPSFYSQASHEKALYRYISTCCHELGHIFGIDHCQ